MVCLLNKMIFLHYHLMMNYSSTFCALCHQVVLLFSKGCFKRRKTGCIAKTVTENPPILRIHKVEWGDNRFLYILILQLLPFSLFLRTDTHIHLRKQSLQ